MKAIIKLDMKKHLQDRGLLFWMILLPIAFTVLAVAIFAPSSNAVDKQQVIISIVPGYTVMFVFFIMISMVTSFLKDRDMGMTARLASTPLSTRSYLLGKWIPFMLIVWIQILFLLMFGKLVYNLPIAQPVFLLCLTLALSFTATGLGLALALIVKTDNMGIALTQVVALGGAMLGGLWMPLDLLPEVMQTIARTLPQYWAHQAFQAAIQGTLGYWDFIKSMLIVTGFGLGGFLISIVRYPHFLKHARG